MLQFIQSWDNPTSATRNNLVFANRNQVYGAFSLRQHYHQSLTKAFIITCSLFASLLLIPVINNLFAGNQKLIAKPDNEIIFEINTDPVLKPEVMPTIPKQQASVVASTYRFEIPKVTDDVITENFPVQNPNNNLNPGTTTTNGDTTVVSDVPPLDADTVTNNSPVSITDVQEIPSFPGGISAMMSYLIRNLHYPHNAREANINGTVYLSFVIDKNGVLTDAIIMRGIGGGCDEEALRVVKTMPTWSAGKQNGRAVSVKMVLPVKFSLR